MKKEPNKIVPVYRVSLSKGVRRESIVYIPVMKIKNERDEFMETVKRIKDNADSGPNKI